MTGITRPATVAELAWVAPPAVRSRLVDDVAELVAIAAAEPWRVRVTDRGEAALLDRWRTHLDDCAVLGLWCSPRRVPVLMTDLADVARDLGFGRLLGPLVPEDAARPYLDAGLHVIERVLVLRLDRPSFARAAAREVSSGVTIREATLDDLPAIVALDAAAFEPFWHYDVRILTRLMHTDRVAVAEKDARIIGYTLATARGGDGSLGRLAVAGEWRGRGIGRALAAEAVAWIDAQGARTIVLSTQETNALSRALYRGMGFREMPDVLVACATAPFALPDMER